jgi:hypothetical protein
MQQCTKATICRGLIDLRFKVLRMPAIKSRIIWRSS